MRFLNAANIASGARVKTDQDIETREEEEEDETEDAMINFERLI